MPSKDDLTPSESALLVVLLSEARDISNKELDERFGFTLTGESRTKLNRLKFVDSWREGNKPYVHRLGEAGWARCQQPFNFDNVRPRAFGAALGSLLTAVNRDLQRTGRSLAMAFAPEMVSATSQETRPVSTGELRRRIRDAYLALTARPGAWVSLADIRVKLGDAVRAEVDTALRELEREPDVNIVPQSNQKALTDADNRAAIVIGDQAKHFLAIGV